MSDYIIKPLLLIGAGGMALEYAKVLKSLAIPFTVIGRGDNSATTFEHKMNVKVHRGGLLRFYRENIQATSDFAIVAVGVDQLAEASSMLIKKRTKNILVEKPGGLDHQEIKQLSSEARSAAANVYVAYNRRFYSSVIKAREVIEEDGGVHSFNFEFTEWPHVIQNLDVPIKIKHHWFLANSTHVVDMAFYLGGKPKKISCYSSGNLDWHPSASIFSGAGISVDGALFSYQANWESPGRWGVEILTLKHRLIFRPLEKLQIQKNGSVSIEFLNIDDAMDIEYKPGLFRQVQTFVMGDKYDLCTIHDQSEMIDFYNKISNYS